MMTDESRERPAAPAGIWLREGVNTEGGGAGGGGREAGQQRERRRLKLKEGGGPVRIERWREE